MPYLDVSVDYPQKEIYLTDIAQVSYLHLNSGDNQHLNSNDKGYLYRGGIQAITPNRVVVADAALGEILFFSREGMPVSHFNRKGNGPGEYRRIHRIFYDEAADDVFAVEPMPINIIHVYSSVGEHKRDIAFPLGKMVMNDIVSWDDESFFFLDTSPDYHKVMATETGAKLPVEGNVASFYRISKTDGALLDSVKLPVTPLFLGINYQGRQIPGFKTRLIKQQEGVFICNPDTDTIFIYNSNKSLTPVISKNRWPLP